MKRFRYLSIAVILLFVLVGLVYAGNKSPMFSRSQPGGMFGVINETQTTGNIWFVDSGSANASDAAGYGENPDAPFATGAYAATQCSASNGDWIIGMPGHVENISTESQINFNVAGVRFIGLGTGRNRPVLTWTGASGMVEIAAANVSIENIVMDMSRSGGVHTGVSVSTSATDFKLKSCEIVLSDDAGGKVGHGIYLSGGTRSQIVDNVFYGSKNAGSGVTDVIWVGSRVDELEIKNNYIRAYVVSATELYGGAISGVGSKVTGFQMDSCLFDLGNSGSSPFYFDQTTKTNGLVTNTYSIGGSISGTTKIDPIKIQDFPNIAN